MAIKIEVNKSIKNISNIKAESLSIDITNVNYETLKIFEDITTNIKNDRTLSEADRSKILDDIKILLREIQLKKPRKNIVNTILSSLGSLSSIAALIDKVLPFLPKLY